MLIAIALSGLAAAFAAPIILSSNDDDDEDLLVADPASGDEETSDLLEEAFLPEEADADADATTDGEVFDLVAGEGEYEFEEFDPEQDVARIEMASEDATITTGFADDGTPEVYATMPDGEEMTLCFPGLSDVPGAAIELVIPEGDDGAPLHLSLNEVLGLGTADDDAAAHTTFVLDGWGDFGDGVFDEPTDDLDGLVPIAPGDGDEVDEPTDPIDDLLPVAPGSGDDEDTPVDPLPDVTPVAPNPGDGY